MLEVQSSNFQATELPNVIDHFLCKACSFVVYQPKECSKCSSVYCHECSQQLVTKNAGRWKCLECQDTNKVIDMHRVVKEVLEKLVFKCPKCDKVKRTYNEIFKHMETCDGGAGSAPLPSFATPVGPGSLS